MIIRSTLSDGQLKMDLFEGTEKKLEIIFDGPIDGFRDNSDGRWRQIVRTSGAEILNRISSPQLDAYLLSESSLFVWDDRVLMITCGSTRLAAAVPPMMAFVDPRRVGHLFFERKNPIFPNGQPTAFGDDVSILREYFQGQCIRLGAPSGDHVYLFWSAGPTPPPVTDVTFQVLMHDLSEEASAAFSPTAGLPENWRLDSLKGLYPFSMIDDHVFSPQGYSLNAIENQRYFTVHVTPQPEGSYASFETNQPMRTFESVIRQLIRIFNPARMSVLLTTSTDSDGAELHERIRPVRRRFTCLDGREVLMAPYYRTTFLNLSRSTRMPAS
jgi:S-adenosylmethionine decarboxylase